MTKRALDKLIKQLATMSSTSLIDSDLSSWMSSALKDLRRALQKGDHRETEKVINEICRKLVK